MNIFVAKLNRSTKAEDLTKVFSAFGEVISSKIIYDRITGSSKGYGFVEMANPEEAEKAIQELNESTLNESVIVVKKAHPREDRQPQDKQSGHRIEKRPLKPDITKDDEKDQLDADKSSATNVDKDI